MKFHLIVVALAGACVYLLYLFVFGFKAELEEARSTIRLESVKSVQNKTKINEKPELKPFINKALSTEPKPVVHQSTFDQAENVGSEESISVTPEAFSSRLDERDYWCRNVTLIIDNNPVKCMYPDACFGCQGTIIPPEVPSARPICADGTESQLFHVECCPTLDSSGVVCPSVEQCFNADIVPPEGCTCNGSSNCHLENVNESTECVCKQ